MGAELDARREMTAATKPQFGRLKPCAAFYEPSCKQRQPQGHPFCPQAHPQRHQILV